MTEATATPTIPTKTPRPHKDGKAARIRKLLSQGKSPKDIAALVGTTPGYVYSVSRLTRNKPKTPKGKVGRPKGTTKTNWKTIAVAVSGKPFKFNPVTDLPPSLWQRIRAVFIPN